MPHMLEWRCRNTEHGPPCQYALAVKSGRGFHLDADVHVQYLEVVALSDERSAARAHAQCPRCGAIRIVQLASWDRAPRSA